MAISIADIAALPAYSDSDMLTLYKWALVNNAAGTTRSINGRSISFPSVKDIRDTIAWLESRVDAASNAGGMNALVQFGEPQ